MELNGEAKTTIKSVQKSLQILKYIVNDEGEVGISELQRELGYSSSTIHHLLQTLVGEGFVSQSSSSKKYEIGPEFLYATLEHKGFGKFFARAIPLLKDIAADSGETTILYVLSGNEAMAVLGQETTRTIRARFKVGRKIPLHSTATGKAFLAYLPEERVGSIIRATGLQKLGANTITDEDGLVAELGRIRDRGYSIEIDEYEELINALGFPVVNPHGKIFAVVCVVGPSGRFTPEVMDGVAPRVVPVVRTIAAKLASPYF